MIQWKNVDRWALALVACAAVITVGVYSRLPDPMPVHFDWRGRADGYLPRAIAAPMLLALAPATWAFVRFGGALLSGEARERYQRSPIAGASLLLTAFMVGLHLCVLWAALHDGAFGRGFSLLVASLWMALGLLLPKVRRNPFMGVRVRWSLRSDENWARTHRFAGQCFVAGALVGFAVGSLPLTLIAVLSSAIVPVVYSWWLGRAG
jgi:uncharacterized membrane protein